MFYIVETEKALLQLSEFKEKRVFIEVISTNDYFHPILTETVAVYLRPLEEEKGFIIPILHDESLNLGKEKVSALLGSFKHLYTVNRKEVLYHFLPPNLIDLSLLCRVVTFKELKLDRRISTIEWFYRKHNTNSSLNKLIPLTKLYERCEKTYFQIEDLLKIRIPTEFSFFNDRMINLFFEIEKEGVGVSLEEFYKVFTVKDPAFNIKESRIYTDYNLYNITLRPTNSFNSVNFAAIPKTKKHRKCFVPTNDYFLEFDFDGYHLRLLANLLDYRLTQESAHKQLAKVVFNKEEITEEEYTKMKQINFEAVYKSIPEKYKHLEFFKRLDNFNQELWREFEEKGGIYDPISKRLFSNLLEDMYPSKLMNYLIQSMETSRNVEILEKVVNYLKNKKTKIVLYVYDSIILDFAKEDKKETLDTVKELLEEGGKYPVKFRYSKNLFF